MSLGSISAHETGDLTKLSPSSQAGRRKVVELFGGDGAVYTIIKRDGMLAPFDISRVQRTVETAMRKSHSLAPDNPLPDTLAQAAEQIVTAVWEHCSELASCGACLSVEGVQDILEERFIHAGYYNVAKQFAAYREERRTMRQESILHLKVLRADGRTWARFNPAKITAAIERAFCDSGGSAAPAQRKTVAAINAVSRAVLEKVRVSSSPERTITENLLADLIEEQLMAAGLYQAAKCFILSRTKHTGLVPALRPALDGKTTISRRRIMLEVNGPGRAWVMKDRFGSDVRITESGLRRKFERLCRGLADLDFECLLAEHTKSLCDGAGLDEIDGLLIEQSKDASLFIPGRQQLMVRILLGLIYRGTLGCEWGDSGLEEVYRKSFEENLRKCAETKVLDPAMLGFDVARLSQALKPQRDEELGFAALSLIHAEFLLRIGGCLVETPQQMWMRIAMGLALNERRAKTDRALEFYDLLSRRAFLPGRAILLNSGRFEPRLNCHYRSPAGSQLTQILSLAAASAEYARFGASQEIDWTGAECSTAREEAGILPFLTIVNEARRSTGARVASALNSLEIWHIDIERFLQGIDTQEAISAGVLREIVLPDLFMRRALRGESWMLFSPKECLPLTGLTGEDFSACYLEYEERALRGELGCRKINASVLWQRVLDLTGRSGALSIRFKDRSAALPGTQTAALACAAAAGAKGLPVMQGWVNLAAHVKEGGFDVFALAHTAQNAVRMLDNAIDLTIESSNSPVAGQSRPIAIGLMGLHEALIEQGMNYGSPEALSLAETAAAAVSIHTALSSRALAQERGPCWGSRTRGRDPGASGSGAGNWQMIEERVRNLPDFPGDLDWHGLREFSSGAARNTLLEPADSRLPAALAEVSPGVEPLPSLLDAKYSLLSRAGELLRQRLTALDLWDEQMSRDLKYFAGCIGEIERIPLQLRQLFSTAGEMSPEWVLQFAGRLVLWTGSRAPCALFHPQMDLKRSASLAAEAWRKGLASLFILGTSHTYKRSRPEGGI